MGPSLSVLQVFHSVRFICVYIVGSWVFVESHCLTNHSIFVNRECCQSCVPIADSYQVRLVFVPSEVTSGSSSYTFPIKLSDLARVAKNKIQNIVFEMKLQVTDPVLL